MPEHTPPSVKRIAAVTMVRNDDFFLHKWVTYYGRQLGKENLYIYFDGTDQQVPPFCQGTNTHLHEKIGDHVTKAEKGRLRFLSLQAATLLQTYDLVIGTDADEYIVVDPAVGSSLAEYLSRQDISISMSALGLDFGQKLPEEQELHTDKPFLSQRRFAQIGTRYTKPCIVARPCIWGAGFHRVKGHNFHIATGLYLMHFGYSDLNVIKARTNDGDRASQGWGKHIAKRSRTIRFVNTLPARNFDKWTRLARIIQTWCRPPYAWNKPAMFELRIVVQIPQRFRDIL